MEIGFDEENLNAKKTENLNLKKIKESCQY